MSDFGVKDLMVTLLPEAAHAQCEGNTAICPEPPTKPDCFAGTAVCPEPPTNKPDCFAGTAICPEPPTMPVGATPDWNDEEFGALSEALDKVIREP